MAGHTKGPWRLDSDRHPASLMTGDYHFIDAGDGVNSPEHGYVGFSIAGFLPIEDVRLIAAAPDLLAALEALVKASYEDDYRAALVQSHAAIRLAKLGAASTDEEAV